MSVSSPHIKRLDNYRLEIFPSYKQGMNASATIYADAGIEEFIEAGALDQAANSHKGINR